MPYQVNWQSVSMKSQRPVHVLAASAARASTPQQAPAAARIVAAKMPSFVMSAPAPTWTIVTWKMSVARHIPTLAKNFDPSGVRATAVLHGQIGSTAVHLGLATEISRFPGAVIAAEPGKYVPWLGSESF